jgi:pyruvate dehydrogenase E1 component
VPDQIAPWIPGGLTTLGTDGFGRSDTRKRLRRFFEVDAESTVIATLHALAEKGQLDKRVIGKAIKDLGVDPEKAHPQIV